MISRKNLLVYRCRHLNVLSLSATNNPCVSLVAELPSMAPILLGCRAKTHDFLNFVMCVSFLALAVFRSLDFLGTVHLLLVDQLQLGLLEEVAAQVE